MTRDVPMAALLSMNSRRVCVARDMLHLPRRAVDGPADALIGPAAADIGHRLIDFGVGGARPLGKECGGGQDLSRLAEPTLGHVFRDPGALHRMGSVGRQS